MIDLTFDAMLSDGSVATCFPVRENQKENIQRYVLKQGFKRPFAIVSVFFDAPTRSAKTNFMVKISGITYPETEDCSGKIYLKALRMKTDSDTGLNMMGWPSAQGGDDGKSLHLLSPLQRGEHYIAAGVELSWRCVYGPGRPSPRGLAPAERLFSFGALPVDRSVIQEVMGSYEPRLPGLRTPGPDLGPYWPYGNDRQGDDAGGYGVQITPLEEVYGSGQSLEDCLKMAMRQATRTHNVLIDETGNILAPQDFPDLHAFDAFAGTSDNARHPFLNKNTQPGTHNIGTCYYENEVERWKNHNDEHWTRSKWGLEGLIHYLPDTSAERAWALETYYARCCFLWNEIPHLPSAGMNWPGQIANGVKGYWDRDEGWTLYAAATLDGILHDRPGHLSEKARHVRQWHSVLQGAYIVAAREDNGLVQSVGKGEKHWSSNPWSRNSRGEQLQDGTRATYSFQTEICATAALISNLVLENDVLYFTAEKSMDYLARFFTDSSGFEVNGGKRGPADIVGTNLATSWGAGVITNGLAADALLGKAERVLARLGASTLKEALEVIKRDTNNGHSGDLKWSAIAACLFKAAIDEGLEAPPVREEPVREERPERPVREEPVREERPVREEPVAEDPRVERVLNQPVIREFLSELEESEELIERLEALVETQRNKIKRLRAENARLRVELRQNPRR